MQVGVAVFLFVRIVGHPLPKMIQAVVCVVAHHTAMVFADFSVTSFIAANRVVAQMARHIQTIRAVLSQLAVHAYGAPISLNGIAWH